MKPPAGKSLNRNQPEEEPAGRFETAPTSRLSCYAVTAPGLEEILAQEMRRIGLLPKWEPSSRRGHQQRAGNRGEPHPAARNPGGVPFEGRAEHLYRANYWLRTASRILVRLGDFYAPGFAELREQAGQLAWERFLVPGQPVLFQVTSHLSRLYHTGAVAERTASAIADRLGREVEVRKPADDDDADPAQLIVVRLVNNQCTISIDSSGELLHRRGYRLETAKAPLRETLAAAMLLASGWDRASPLLDPFCGSGTIPIEAALWASGRPPGAQRTFAFEHWPEFDPVLWKKVQSGSGVRPFPVVENVIIQGSDRDAGAVRVSQANAERAGVTSQVEFTCRAVSAVEPPAGPGWVVTNPPYGIRVSENKDLRNLYAQFGNVLRARCPGWQVTVLSSEARLLGQIGIDFDPSLATVNGGVGVRIARGHVPGPGHGDVEKS